jgi:hypothetical protein
MSEYYEDLSADLIGQWKAYKKVLKMLKNKD